MKKIILLLCIFTLTVSCVLSKDIKFPLPGSSIANTKLQYDSYVPVITAAGTKAPKNCQDVDVTDTKVTKEPYNLKQKNGQYISGNWEEEWTVTACGKNVYVPIKFILDNIGATYSISVDDVYTK